MGLAALLLPGAAAQASPSRGDDKWPLCARSDADRAIVACTSIIRERDPDLALALYDRGIAWRLTRQFERALADLNRAIQLQADFAAAFVERGIVHYEMRHYTQAIADNDAAIRLKPDLAEAFNNRALARLKLGQYDLATADFNRTIRLHQYYGNALINRSLGPLEPPEPPL
jgi:tetratricopeptide (TPR) repeat protein